MTPQPLWERALERRHVEQLERVVRANTRATAPKGTRAGGKRRHPPAKVGDVFGDVVVVALVPRGHLGRSDERVEVKCRVCGHRAEAFVFNLRNRAPRHNARHGGTR